MSVLERIKNGELSIRINTGIGSLRNVYAENELIELAEIGQRSQWISVKRILPDYKQKVDIFLIEGGRVANVTFIDDGTEDCTGDMYFNDNDFDDVVYAIEEVSHWMSIPNDPKQLLVQTYR